MGRCSVAALGKISMMPFDYISKSGETKKNDLDAVFDVIGGYSQIRNGWAALIIYIPRTNVFVELRDSPQDVRGNSKAEAEEVDEIYIQKSFGLSQKQIAVFKEKPEKWLFIDYRKNA